MLDRDFGPYRLLQRLGRGGMADVYLARNTETGADVALKLVEDKADRDSQDICEAERRGAALQQQFGLVDGHVPKVHGCQTFGGYFCIEMEYVDGEDLAERIARRTLDPNAAAWIASELCDFLQKAHDFETALDGVKLRGIIHGDIKPKNVRLNSVGNVKVLDFGIAKGLALSRKLTRNDFGSLAYLSPERLESGEVDIHVDFWSVGVLLYEMLAGTPPFEAEANSKLEALIRRREPPPALPGSCPPPLVRIVLKMLAGDQARRYQTAAAAFSDLRAFVIGHETDADREWAAGVEREATRRTVPVGGSPNAADDTRRTGPSPADESAPPSEETRRTAEAPQPDVAADSEATRRTTAASPDVPEPVPTPAAAPAPAPPRPAALARLAAARQWAVVLLVVAGIALVGNEAVVWSAAKDLRVTLATGQGDDMQGVWDRYQNLSHRSLLGIGLAAVRAPLKERLRVQADRVVDDYRQNEPVVREAQWRQASTWLTDLLNIDPGDRAAGARLSYCNGHLQRIAAEARKRKKQPATKEFRDAVAQFEEAARLDNRWPDPYLGLMRTYVYGVEDLDKAIEAMHEAEKRGYRTGNRELVQMADGYRGRADRMRREATGVKGLGQERVCLEKAADDYAKAIDIYGQAIGFGEAGGAVRQTQARLDEVRRRLADTPEAQF
jgi:eukaryotic-like serine/threonine-protein kinase